MIYVDPIDGGSNGGVVLTFEQKADFFKRYLKSDKSWQKLAEAIKNNQRGSSRILILSVFRKISEDRASAENKSAKEIFKEMVATLDQHLAQIQ